MRLSRSKLLARASLKRMLVVLAMINAITPTGLMLFHEEVSACELEFSSGSTAAFVSVSSAGCEDGVIAPTPPLSLQNALPVHTNHSDSCDCDNQSNQRDTVISSSSTRINRSPHDSPYLFSVVEDRLVNKNADAMLLTLNDRIQLPTSQLEQLSIVVLLI